MDDENFQKCWALENLRPFDSIENIKKGNYEITKLEENTDEDEQDKKLQKSIKAWLGQNKKK